MITILEKMAQDGLTKEVTLEYWPKGRNLLHRQLRKDHFKQREHCLIFEAERRPVWPRKTGRVVAGNESREEMESGEVREGLEGPWTLFQGLWLLLLVKGELIQGLEQKNDVKFRGHSSC